MMKIAGKLSGAAKRVLAFVLMLCMMMSVLPVGVLGVGELLGVEDDSLNITFTEPANLASTRAALINPDLPSDAIVQASTNGSHTMAIRNDGSLFAWGHNFWGELGLGDRTDRLTPVQVQPGTTWVSVSVGFGFTAAIDSNGSLWTWGMLSYTEGYGFFGANSNSNEVPVHALPGTTWTSISADTYIFAAIDSDGALWLIGNAYASILGYPTQVRPGTAWVSVETGSPRIAAIDSNGVLWDWFAEDTPEQIQSDITWVSATSGSQHGFAIDSSGDLWAWGENSNGSLGVGYISTYEPSPLQVQTNTPVTWKDVSSSSTHTLAVDANGGLWAWGYYNDRGQLGIGTIGFEYSTPIRIGAEASWERVWVGHNSTVAIKDDGSLWGWGANPTGALGTGSTTDSHIPIPVIGSGANPVTSLSIAGESYRQLTVGSRMGLSIITPYDVSNQGVIWSSDNPDVVSIYTWGTGVVAANAPGTARITVTTVDCGSSAYVDIYVPPIPVTDVVINPPLTTFLPIGGTLTLTADVAPDDATNRNVAWSVRESDTNIASVNSSTGVVTASSDTAGVARIIARSESTPDKSDFIDITVYTPVTAADISSNTTMPMRPGGTGMLTVDYDHCPVAYRSVAWSSDASSIVSVDSSTGDITAHAPGDARITATVSYGVGDVALGSYEAHFDITVAAISVEGITLTPDEATIFVGGDRTLTASLSPDNAANQAVTWHNSNPAAVTIVPDPLDNHIVSITADAIGEAVITVTAEDGGFSAESKITVTEEPVSIESVALPPELHLERGESKLLEDMLTLEPVNTTEPEVIWSLSEIDPPGSVALNDNRYITANEIGTAVLKATSAANNDIYAETIVTVSPVAVRDVVLSRNATTIAEGRIEFLRALVNPSDAANKKVIWTSDNTAVATVDQSGMVTAVSVGTAAIRASAEADHDIYAEGIVTVREGPPVLRFSERETRVYLDDAGFVTLSFGIEGSSIGSAVSVSKNNQPFTDFSQSGNSITIQPAAVSGLRDVYTVRATAANRYDETGSDVAQFEVYNRNALSSEFGPSITLDYSPAIQSGRTAEAVEARLAARNSLTLTRNFMPGTDNFPWTGLDTLIWEISDSSVAEVYQFRSGMWQPASPDLPVSPFTPVQIIGYANGTATLTVTHVKSGMTANIPITVNSMRGQLYFVRVSPTHQAEVAYTTGTGLAVTAQTNSRGEIAIFEPDGIMGDIQFTARSGSSLLLGSIPNEQVLAEQYGRGQLYPMSAVRLELASNQAFFSYLPDGQPYVGRVAVAGGLFRNGAFVQGSQMSIPSVQVENGGMFSIDLDPSGFGTLSAGDELQFAYEVRFLDGDYAPQIIWVDGFARNNRLVLDDAVLRLQAWDGQGFTAIQYLYEDDRQFDITNNTTYVGLTSANPEGVLTAILMTNENAVPDTLGFLRFVDEFGYAPTNQRIRPLNAAIPFLSDNFTYYSLDLAVNEHLNLQEGELRHYYIMALDGRDVLRRVDLPFGIFNGVGLGIPDEYTEFDFDIGDVMSDTSVFGDIFGSGNSGVALDIINNLLPTSIDLPDNLPFVINMSRDKENPLVLTIRGVYARNWSKEHTWKPGQRDQEFPKQPNEPQRPKPPDAHWSDGPYANAYHANKNCQGLRQTLGVGNIHSTPLYEDIAGDNTRAWGLTVPAGSPRCQGTGCASHWTRFDAERAQFNTELRVYEVEMERFQAENEKFQAEFDRAFNEEKNKKHKPMEMNATFSASASSSGYFVGTLGWDIHTQGFVFEFTEVSITLGANAGMKFSARIPLPVVPVPGLAITLSFEAGIGASVEAIIAISDIGRSGNDWLFITADTKGYLRFRGAIGADVWVAAADVGAFAELDLAAQYVTHQPSNNWGSRVTAGANIGIDYTYRLGPPINLPRWLGGAPLYTSGRGVIWQHQLFDWQRTWGNPELLGGGRSRAVAMQFATQAILFETLASTQIQNLPIEQLPTDDPVIAGDERFAAAAWVSVNLTDDEWEQWGIDMDLLDDGEGEMETADLIALANLTEITVSIYDGQIWSDAYNLTDDNFPDINPVVAVCGEGKNAAAVWQRMTFVDGGVMSFVDEDGTIIETPIIENYSTDLWYSIYSPGSGWADARQIDTGIIDGGMIGEYKVAVNGSDIAVIITVLDEESETYDIHTLHVNTVGEVTQAKVTSDGSMNIQPQISRYGDGFILAYYTNDTDGDSDIVINLLASNGEIDNAFIQSVAPSAGLNGVLTSPDYQLYVGEAIAVAWVAYNVDRDKDVVYAAKLVEHDGRLLFTSPIEIDMPDIPSADIVFPLFTDRFAYSIHTEESNVVPGFDLPVSIIVTNTGISEITQVSLEWRDGTVETWDANIPPGGIHSQVIYVALGDELKNLNYEIGVSFANGQSASTGGILAIALPDISIGRTEITLSERGIREFSVNLFNFSDVGIESGQRVRLSFYRDPMLTVPVGVARGSGQIAESDYINAESELSLINDGGLSLTYRYVITGDDLDGGEVPSGGIRLFISAEIIDASGNPVPESDYSANRGNVLLASRLRFGQEAVIASAERFDSGNATADVSVTNNSMNSLPGGSGRIVALLLDESGGVVETQTLMVADALPGESSRGYSIGFAETGHSVAASFEAVSTAAADSALSSLSLSSIPFVLDGAAPPVSGRINLTAENVHGVSATRLTAVARNSDAAISVNGAEFGDIASVDISLQSETVVDIVVKAGASETAYRLSIASQLPDLLTGTPTISSTTPRVGDTLTGSLAGGNNTGTLTYTWKANGGLVGSGESYTVAAADLGKAITLEITSSVEAGTLTSAPTAAVAVAQGGGGPGSGMPPAGPGTPGTQPTPTTPGAEDGGEETSEIGDPSFADELYKLGLFIGTGTDSDGNPIFDLEDELTRIQALILTIRLLGLEEEALAFGGVNPFADVPAWAAPYAAFAFDRGITNGVSATAFDPSRPVTVREFTAFLMRVLGYSDREGGDFLYAETLARAVEVSLYSDALLEDLSGGQFLRGDAVTAMVSALLANIKDDEDLLLIDTLVESEVVTRDDADAFIQAVSDRLK